MPSLRQCLDEIVRRRKILEAAEESGADVPLRLRREDAVLEAAFLDMLVERSAQTADAAGDVDLGPLPRGVRLAAEDAGRSREETAAIVARRFGPGHDRPCLRPEVTTCASWACQERGRCRDDRSTVLVIPGRTAHH